MTPLEAIIRRNIAQQGPIPFDIFMEMAMRHEQHGYYMTRDPLGQRGDFVTAPEISQMFGEMIALWCVDTWMKMGSPSKFILLEVGPGRGTLMDDVLRTVKVSPAFCDAAQVFMLERSPALKRKQEEKLKGYTIRWIADFAELPKLPVVMFCNELLDTFAIKRFQKTAHGWSEMAITVQDNALGFTLMPPTRAFDAYFSNDVFLRATPGSFAEISPDCASWMDRFTPLLKEGGAGLIIDYGYEGPAPLDTVQAIRAQKTAPILEGPGDADITAYVDFNPLRRIAAALGMNTYPLRAQRDFLLHCGILQRASLLKAKASTPEQHKEMDIALDRLMGGEQMGMLFKFFCVTHPSLPVPLAF
jgi:NADH dehydrogenase [ubiquinone] 1 alpha subcomplex assembly factor 7